MLTREFIKVSLLKMSLQYPFFGNQGDENSETMVDTWREHFKDTSREGFSYAVSTHIDTSTETPTIAHLKRILNERPRETAGEDKGRSWEAWCTPEENRFYAKEFRKTLKEAGIRRMKNYGKSGRV